MPQTSSLSWHLWSTAFSRPRVSLHINLQYGYNERIKLHFFLSTSTLGQRTHAFTGTAILYFLHLNFTVGPFTVIGLSSMKLDLQKLAGSEEILTIPKRDGLSPSSEVTQIESSIQANLLKIGLRDYNPLQHELGFHMKLNALRLRRIILYRAIVPRRSKPISKPDFRRAAEQTPIPTMLDSQFDEDGHMLTQLTDEGRKACDDEWEQLVVNELNGSLSPAFLSVREIEVRSPDESLAEKTSSILERLEPPRSQTRSPSSPDVAVNNLNKQMTGPPCASMKKPLVPFEQSDHERLYSLSQPLKPNFQRFKRKLKQDF
ncbi:hypothetical protein EJ110_NYTH16436 [Nymphaea thermarum]|nr:hypothetical protein EJ110_NYTH16436 [Nymphaea thermarum]